MCLKNETCTLTFDDFVWPAVKSGPEWPLLAFEEIVAGMATITAQSERIAASGATPVLLHIGATTFDKEHEDYHWMLARIPVAHQLVLVEPNSELIPQLEENAATKLPKGQHAPKVINGAICPTSGEMSLYVPDRETIAADFRFLPASSLTKLSEVASLDYDKTAASLTEFWPINPVHPRYISTKKIRCYSPADLLAELGVAPSSVVWIATDTEGFDAKLMPLFLTLDSFKPAGVQFEWAYHHGNDTAKVDELKSLALSLHAGGYDVRKSMENMFAFL